VYCTSKAGPISVSPAHPPPAAAAAASAAVVVVMQLKERQKEDHMYDNTKKLITSAYRCKLEEDKDRSGRRASGLSE